MLLHQSLTRHGFLATLASRTWRPRAVTASALADLDAVASRTAYAAWLRRTSTAWSHLPLAPVTPDGTALAPWPLRTVGPDVLDGRAQLAADLRDLAVAVGGVAVLPARRPVPAQEQPDDAAFLVGAAWVAVVAATDAAVLGPAAAALGRTPGAGRVGTRFLERCREIAPARYALQGEIAAWAADAGTEAADRAIATARTLSLELAQALRGSPQGW